MKESNVFVIYDKKEKGYFTYKDADYQDCYTNIVEEAPTYATFDSALKALLAEYSINYINNRYKIQKIKIKQTMEIVNSMELNIPNMN